MTERERERSIKNDRDSEGERRGSEGLRVTQREREGGVIERNPHYAVFAIASTAFKEKV